jgi:hypothetical protein
MPGTSEKGHAKNVANLSKLIEVCKGFGTKYNPAKTALKVANLETKLTDSKADLQSVKDTNQAESTVRNNRKVSFKGKNKLSTRFLAALKTSEGVSDETIEDAASINKKVQGERITDLPTINNTEGTPEKDNTISTAQLSYTNIVDHYKKYRTLIVSLGANYAPNETDVNLASLTAKITEWETLNEQVDTAETASKNALIKRDKNFYTEKTGIPDLGADVKEYVKSVFGAGSPEHKMVTKISFSNPTKNTKSKAKAKKTTDKTK